MTSRQWPRQDDPDGYRPAHAEARLPADVGSVSLARRVIEESLTGWDLPRPVCDDAVLVVSELVTNAVIHARTPVVVDVERLPVGVRLAVTDGSDQAVMRPLPEPRVEEAGLFDDLDDLDLDALLDALPSTGRGLGLVEAISDAWGSVPVPGGGKQVWAVIGAGRDAGGDGGGSAPTAGRVVGADQGAAGGEGWLIRMVALPARLIAESDQDFDALARELQVIARADAPTQEVEDLAGAAAALVDELHPFKTAGHDAVREALARGDRVVDLHLPLTTQPSDVLTRLGGFLRMTAAARRGQMLLTLPPPDEVVEFRRWYASEVRRQEAGLPPEPCPFPVIPPHARRTERREELGRRRRALLERLRHELHGLSDRSAVVDRVFEGSLEELGASFAAVHVFDPAAGDIVCLGRTRDRGDAGAWLRFPLSSLSPPSETVRTGRAVVVRTVAERHARYPGLPPTGTGEDNPALATVPMTMAGPLPSAAVLAPGALTVGFSRTRDFSAADLAFLEHLADLVADALDAVD